MRKDFSLLPEDEQELEELGLQWETIIDGSHWVLLHEFPTHPGYNVPLVSVAIRLETGYPNTALDMAYFHPALSRKDGHPIRATNVNQSLDGKVWQRWSRHRTPQNPWIVGQDNLGTHILLVQDWLAREFEK